MSLNTARRLNRLRQSLTENGLDGILVSQPENRYYLSGFDGSAGYLLITQRDSVLATDFRYMEQASAQAVDYQVFQTTCSLADWLPGLLSELRATRLGFESGDVTFAFYQQLSDIMDKSSIKTELVPQDGLVEPIRAIKEPGELELITRASEISDRAFEHIEDSIRAGMTELEVAWEIERFMRENGSQTIPFEVIVASGLNSARPHASPGQCCINEGEPVVIDIGARVGGYCSDLTRTICLGVPNDTFKKVYDTVLGAQLTAIATIIESMTGEEADGLARTVIKEAGYTEAFGHGLGHGVGLAPHENPRLGPGSRETLDEGMVFTIEPGIYLSGWGGVRVEDLAVMTNGRVNLISKARKL